MWLRRLQDDLRLARQYDAQAWHAEVMAFTLDWTRGNGSVPSCPRGDAVETAKALCLEWNVCNSTNEDAAHALQDARRSS